MCEPSASLHKAVLDKDMLSTQENKEINKRLSPPPAEESNCLRGTEGPKNSGEILKLLNGLQNV